MVALLSLIFSSMKQDGFVRRGLNSCGALRLGVSIARRMDLIAVATYFRTNGSRATMRSHEVTLYLRHPADVVLPFLEEE